jgi:hypothetical protein
LFPVINHTIVKMEWGRRMSTQGADENSNSGDDVKPWWKKPTFVAAATAVAVTVAGAWLTQGGNALYDAVLGGEESTRPTVTESVNRDPFCASWLLNKEPEVVGAQIRNRMSGLDPLGVEARKRLEEAQRSSGSRLPIGDVVEVTVEGNKEKVVVLDRLEPKIVKRSNLGSVMAVGHQCGGGFPIRYYAVDLDAPRPEFLLYEGDGSGDAETKPINFPYKVSSVEPEKFVLTGKTDSVVEWTATLHWTADGKKGKTDITDNGKPFVSYPVTTKLFFDTGTGKLQTSP